MNFYKQKNNLPRKVITLLHTLSLLVLFSMYTDLRGYGQIVFERSFLRSETNPSFGNLWTLDGLADGEAQGVTHDDNNWFFTWTYNNVGYMFKVPVGVPINNSVLQNPNVSMINGQGNWHWGDPDHYKYDGTDYIVVPMTGGSPSPIVTIFRAANLSIVAYGKLEQESTGWCAIHPISGELYTSEDFDYARGSIPCNPNRDCDDQSWHCPYPRELLRYSIPWNSLPSSGYIGEIPLTKIISPDIELLTANGQSMELYNMQGGEFTPSGEILYISSGSGCCFGNGPGQEYYFDGIYAFNTNTWRTIKRSNNHDGRFPLTNVPKYFDYYYPLGCDGAGSWSPEGLTIWNLDDGRAPGITGQLHVMLFKFRATGENRQVFEHFSNRLYVDALNGVDQSLTPDILEQDALPGAPTKPFKTFPFTYSNYPAWDGSEIVLKAGSYSAVGTYSTRMRILSQGGTAKLGQ